MTLYDIWRPILEFLFPKQCVGCGRSGEFFCLTCLNKVAKSGPIDGKIYPTLDYKDEKLKKAVWLFKYGGYRSLGEVFGEIVYDRILEEAADLKIFSGSGKFIVVPVPLSPKKFRKRGFNQSESIARKICELGDGKLFDLRTDILRKVKETENQMSIKQREKRLKNLAGAFAAADGAELQGKNVILIDDIVTTGATISEAAKVLREAGAREVLAFTVAH